jgi:hypothetical protein
MAKLITVCIAALLAFGAVNAQTSALQRVSGS